MGLKWLLLRYGDPFRQEGEKGLQHLKEMLEAGLSPEYTKNNKTLLYDRLMYNQMGYVCLLLQKGADPNHAMVVSGIKNKEQTTLLSYAFYMGYSLDFLQLFLSYGADYLGLKASRKHDFPSEKLTALDKVAPQCDAMHQARQQGFQAFKENRFEEAREAFARAAALLQTFLEELTQKIKDADPKTDREQEKYRHQHIYADDYQFRLTECHHMIERCENETLAEQIPDLPDLDSQGNRSRSSSDNSTSSWSSWIWTTIFPAEDHREALTKEVKRAAPIEETEETQPLLVSGRQPDAELHHRR